MSQNLRFIFISCLVCLLSACLRPPYNDFDPYNRAVPGAVGGAAGGAAISALTEGSISAGVTGGAVAGIAIGSYMDSRQGLAYQLERANIAVIKYGDIVTVCIPADMYYVFDSPKLNELVYPHLMDLVKFIKSYKVEPVYIAGFTDDVGAIDEKHDLTLARATTMMTFLWGHGLELARLHPKGYGSLFPIADNMFPKGSAFNRRVEIQWRVRPGDPEERVIRSSKIG